MAPSGVVSLRITCRSVLRRASATMAGFGRKKKITGARRPTRISGRAELGEQQVLGHVEREQILGERVDRRDQRDGPERHAAVEGGLLEAADLEAAAARDRPRRGRRGRRRSPRKASTPGSNENDTHSIVTLGDAYAHGRADPPRRLGADDVNELVRVQREVSTSRSTASTLASPATWRCSSPSSAASGWPRRARRLWIAEADGRVVGGDHARDLGGGLGAARAPRLSLEARGTGAGRRLVEQVLEAARAAGYERLELMTFSDAGRRPRALPQRRLRDDEQRAHRALGTRAGLGALRLEL